MLTKECNSKTEVFIGIDKRIAVFEIKLEQDKNLVQVPTYA